MVERRRLKSPPASPAGGDYFPAENVEFIPSGCAVLDCVLGGGWALGRIANIVGDKSTGKTLLAIEACANFAQQYPKGKIWYREAEAAFDTSYASRLGLPLKRVDFGPDDSNSIWSTIEDIFEDLKTQIALCEKTGQPGLYVVDSLDALNSRAKQSREIGAGYNLDKQKVLSEELGDIARAFKAQRMSLLFISQVRDRIGFVVGEKHRRSGGRALDFYASQIVWLSHLKTLTRTLRGVKRATGIRVRVKCKKNKLVPPSRDCDFAIRFGYGIDDLEASLAFLEEIKALGELRIRSKDVDNYLAEAAELSPVHYQQRAHLVRECVMLEWAKVEGWFRPPNQKYGMG